MNPESGVRSPEAGPRGPHLFFAPCSLFPVLCSLFLLLSAALSGCGPGSDAASSSTPADGTGRVAGRVFDKTNGREIGGAFVSLETGRGSRQTVSAPDGSYLFASIAPGSYRLSADAAGFKPSFREFGLSTRASVDVDLALAPSSFRGDLTGVVLDAASGARIAAAVLSVPAKNFTTVTDTGGRFSVPGIDAGLVTVELRAVGYAPFAALVSVPAGAAVLQTFRLLRNAGSLSGTVQTTRPTAANRPLAGAVVRLLEPSSHREPGVSISFDVFSTRPASLFETGIVTRTAADGRYRLDNVTAGIAGLRISADSHDELLVTTAVILGRATRTDAALRFNRATLRGKVTDLAGAPLGGATVSVPEQGLTTLTNGAGLYDLSETVIVRDFPRVVSIQGVLVSLPAQLTAVGAQAAGFTLGSARVPLLPGGVVTLDFVLLRATGDLTGAVARARDGVALPGSVVSLPQLGLTTPVNSSGAFAFSRVPAAFLQINVDSIGFLRQTTFAAVLPNQTSFVRIALSSPGTLTGSVRRLSTGQPIAQARVTLPELARQTLADSGGLYSFAELRPGTIRVDVSAQGFESLTTSAAIVDSGLTRLDVTLRP